MEDLWNDKLTNVIDIYLPSGSGVDSGNSIDVEKSKENLIVIYSSFHCMDENDYYDGWLDFTVKVKPSFSGIDVNIIGRFSDRNYKYAELKDYLFELYYYALNTHISRSD